MSLGLIYLSLPPLPPHQHHHCRRRHHHHHLHNHHYHQFVFYIHKVLSHLSNPVCRPLPRNFPGEIKYKTIITNFFINLSLLVLKKQHLCHYVCCEQNVPNNLPENLSVPFHLQSFQNQIELDGLNSSRPNYVQALLDKFTIIV